MLSDERFTIYYCPKCGRHGPIEVVRVSAELSPNPLREAAIRHSMADAAEHLETCVMDESHNPPTLEDMARVASELREALAADQSQSDRTSDEATPTTANEDCKEEFAVVAAMIAMAGLGPAGMTEEQHDSNQRAVLAEALRMGYDAATLHSVLRKLGWLPPADIDYIEWWDEADKNTRWYRHVGCDGGTSRYMVPLDDCPPPREAIEECAHCCYVRPLRQRVPGEEGRRDG